MTDEQKLVYDEGRHFEDGFNDVYCKCGAHVSYHANQHGPYEIRIDRTKWFCPTNPPEEPGLLGIALGMLR
jgi:hypothetical protein